MLRKLECPLLSAAACSRYIFKFSSCILIGFVPPAGFADDSVAARGWKFGGQRGAFAGAVIAGAFDYSSVPDRRPMLKFTVCKAGSPTSPSLGALAVGRPM